MDTKSNSWPVSNLVRMERKEKILSRDDFAVIKDVFGVVLPESIKDFAKYFGWGSQFCSELRLFPGHLFSGRFEAAAKGALEYQQLCVEKIIDFSKYDPWIYDKYHGEKVVYENLFFIATTGFADDFFINYHPEGGYNIVGVEDEGHVYNMGSFHEFINEYLGNKHSLFRRGAGIDWSYEIGIPVSVREADGAR